MNRIVALPMLSGLLGFLLATAPSCLAVPPSRGYLDPGYTYKAFSGKRIFVSGLSRGNADADWLRNSAEKIAADTSAADSLFAAFNAELLKEIRSGLDGKAEAVLDEGWRTGKLPEGALMSKLYGDAAVPDTLRVRIPSPEYLKTRALLPDVSLLIVHFSFGTRGSGNKVKPNYVGSSGPVLLGSGPGAIWVGGGMAIENEELDEYGEPKNEDKPNKDRGHGTNKILNSITEFCFYDHSSRRAFGYGYDVTETKYHGDFIGALAGKKVEARGHFMDMADHLAAIFLRKNSRLLKNYRQGEIEPAEAKTRPAPVKEVLETSDDE